MFLIFEVVYLIKMDEPVMELCIPRGSIFSRVFFLLLCHSCIFSLNSTKRIRYVHVLKWGEKVHNFIFAYDMSVLQTAQ